MARLAFALVVFLSLLAISFSRFIQPDERDSLPFTSDPTTVVSAEPEVPKTETTAATEFVVVPVHRFEGADLPEDFGYSLRLPSHRDRRPCRQNHKHRRGWGGLHHWWGHRRHEHPTEFPGQLKTRFAEHDNEARPVELRSERHMMKKEKKVSTDSGFDSDSDSDSDDEEDENEEEEMPRWKKWRQEMKEMKEMRESNEDLRDHPHPHHHHGSHGHHRRHHHHGHHRRHQHHHDGEEDQEEEGGFVKWIQELMDRF